MSRKNRAGIAGNPMPSVKVEPATTMKLTVKLFSLMRNWLLRAYFPMQKRLKIRSSKSSV
jgi:hypothetical protein